MLKNRKTGEEQMKRLAEEGEAWSNWKIILNTEKK